MTLALGTAPNSNPANQSLLNTTAINLNGGGLTLNFGASANRLHDTSTVSVNGGGLVTIGTSVSTLSEAMGGFTLNSGQLNLNYANNPSNGGTITFSSDLNRVGTG